MSDILGLCVVFFDTQMQDGPSRGFDLCDTAVKPPYTNCASVKCVCVTWQVNTGAAEVLYSAVGEWAKLDQDSTVLDVCCGTGTIGISLAKVTSVVCNRNFIDLLTAFRSLRLTGPAYCLLQLMFFILFMHTFVIL